MGLSIATGSTAGVEASVRVPDRIEQSFGLIKSSQFLIEVARSDKEYTERLLASTREAVLKTRELIHRSR